MGGQPNCHLDLRAFGPDIPASFGLGGLLASHRIVNGQLSPVGFVFCGQSINQQETKRLYKNSTAHGGAIQWPGLSARWSTASCIAHWGNQQMLKMLTVSLTPLSALILDMVSLGRELQE